MSLSLKESCLMYDRYCRRHLDTPTFEAFNQENFTCLPQNDAIYAEYTRILKGARKAAGIPVTRRLPSLYSKFSVEPLVTTVSTPSVQVRHQKASFVSSLPSISRSVQMNIRAPACISEEKAGPLTVSKVQEVQEVQKIEEVGPLSVSKVQEGEEVEEVQEVQKIEEVTENWSVESYQEELSKNKSVLLKETGGHMVHFIPQVRRGSFESLACKFTKSTWETLRGKSEAPLKMRDGTNLEISSVSLNDGDLAEFVHKIKKKIVGPHFIRFERI